MTTGISRESMSEQRATNDSNGGVPAHPTRLLASGIASPMAVALLLTACGGGGGGNPVTTGTRRETQPDKLPVRPAETPVEEAPADTERPDTEDKENTQKKEDMSADTQPQREQTRNRTGSKRTIAIPPCFHPISTQTTRLTRGRCL